jgi:hypothetical protein
MKNRAKLILTGTKSAGWHCAGIPSVDESGSIAGIEAFVQLVFDFNKKAKP